ncbi:hypothetical protein pb186bvf_011288 [Paramecium bursaria]
MEQQIVHALQLTLGNNQTSINQGEGLLTQLKQAQGFSLAILQVVDNPQYQDPIRLSALVNFKTFVEKQWKKSISVNEQEVIRAQIIDALVRVVENKKLRSQYEDLIFKLVAMDYPQNWPQLGDQIAAKLQNAQSFEQAWGTLLALRRATENFQFLLEDDRKPLEPLVIKTFPYLENLFQKSLEQYNDQTGELIKVILKIFHHAFHLQLPFYLKDVNVLSRWIGYIDTIISFPVPQNLLTLPVDEEEETRREKTYQWTNKKWATRIATRFMQKYCNKNMVDKDILPLCSHITQNYAPVLLQKLYQLLINKQQFAGPRTCLFALKYLFYALKNPHTLALLKPYFQQILFDIALPRMQLTARDANLWQNEPEEYIRRLEDFSVSTYNIKNSANDLLAELCKQQNETGQSYLLVFLQHTSLCLQTGIDPCTNQPLDILKKEALLWGIESQADQILKIENIQQSMEQLLEKHILPELQSQIGFLKARACQVYEQYGTIQFVNKQNVVAAVQGISACIVDKELPVRVAAAISFSSILTHQEAQQLIRPQLNQVLEIYIKLMDIIDNEKLVKSLEEIVKQFQKEITPYAVQLINHLANIFQKYCHKQNQQGDDSDDDGETELAAAGCLEAIKRILNAPLNDDAYLQIEAFIFPILNFALTEIGCDFINECLEILNLILYKRKSGITPGLWFYYPVLIYSVVGLPAGVNIQSLTNLSEEQQALLVQCQKGWATECVSQMVSSIRNYIQKGQDIFLTTQDWFGNNFVQLIFQLLGRVYSIGENGEDETDQNSATTLIFCLIENFKGKLDALMPQIIEFALQNLVKAQKQTRFKVIQIGIICMSIWYNSQMAIAFLDSKGLTDMFFQGVFDMDKHYRYEWDITRVLFALYQCYLNPQTPQYLLNNSQLVCKAFANWTTKLLLQREQDESCDNEEQAIEDNVGYQNTLDKLAKAAIEDEDDDDDPDDSYDQGDEYTDLYDSPLESVDPILLVEQLMMALSQQNPQLYQHMIAGLTQEEQKKLQENFIEGKKQYDEWLKIKAEEAAK